MKKSIPFLLVLFLVTGCSTLSLNPKKQFIFDVPVKALKMTVDYDPAFFPSNNVCGKVTVQNYGTTDYKRITMWVSFTDSFGNILATNTFCLANELASGGAATIEPNLNNPLNKANGILGGNTFRSCPLSMNYGRVEINTEVAVKNETVATNAGPKGSAEIYDIGSEVVKAADSFPAEGRLKEPAFWENAKPFSEIKDGLFYIDIQSKAMYRKYDDSLRYLVGAETKGLDVLEISSPIRSGFREFIKGRLEDTTVYYKYTGLISDNLGTTGEIWQNSFGAKTEVTRLNSKSIGVYFANTRENDYFGKVGYALSKGLILSKYGDFCILVTRKQAEELGRDVTVRVYFSIKNDTNPKNHLYCPAPTKDFPLTTRTDYILYEAELHGCKFIYDSIPEDYFIAVVRE